MCIPEHPQVPKQFFGMWKGKDKIGREVEGEATQHIRVRVRPAFADRKCEAATNELTE